MVETTGKKLSKARLEKGLTVDEVAHATKLRPEKVLALEHDDYSRFPNNAYVKGFLQIYGRFLGVDVGPAVRDLENPNPVSVAEYQYLNHEPPTRSEPRSGPRRPHQNKPSLAPLIVFLLLCAVLGTAGYLYINARRLDPEQVPPPEATAETAPDNASRPPTVKAPPAAVIPAAPPAPERAVIAAPAPATSGIAVGSPVISDRDFLPQAPASPAVAPTPVVNEVTLQPLRKTWVKIRRDDPNSAPIFEDYLYTNAPPLRLLGARFFIEVRDENAVAIRKNGATIAYQSPGITIQ